MNVLLGVTGSVAARLTPKFVRLLKENNHSVKVLTTDRGLYFFNKEDIDCEVITDADEWKDGKYSPEDTIPHIELAQHWADLLIIAPLTANTLSDLATGRCDKLLTATFRAYPFQKRCIIAPAMNTEMWVDPTTMKNIRRLKNYYNIVQIGPVVGPLACGGEGLGAMARIKDIIAAIG